MARILYGVHGTGRGHAIRALTVARHCPEHDFLFVTHSEGARLLRPQFRVLDCPSPATPIGAHRVQSLSAAASAAIVLAHSRHWRSVVREAAVAFAADVAVTDYEYFVPRVARSLGLRCLSLDHQHAITLGDFATPPQQIASRIATSLAIRCLFSRADQYLVTSFFEVPLRRRAGPVRWTPPLLRDEVLALRATAGEHVIAYQGYPTFAGFSDTLSRLGRPVHAYGMGNGQARGSLSFRGFDEQAFHADLAGCAYVICGGGHSLISEALYLGKPVVSIPVAGAFEQLLNSVQLEQCGYGMKATSKSFSLAGLEAFERRLDDCKERIAQRNFRGNEAVFAALDDFISGRWRVPAPRAPK